MRVLVQSEFPCDADRAWDAVQTNALLTEICRPLIGLKPGGGAARIPDRWSVGPAVGLRTYLLMFIPMGTRWLQWERIDHEAREMQSREHDPLIRKWDHRIHVEPLAEGRCRYTDDIEIDAGVLTLPVWAFAQLFYRHRQRRWQAVARRLQSAGSGAASDLAASRA